MDIVVENQNDTTLIQLNGRLDATNAPEVESQLLKAVADTTRVVIDMEKLDYISSAGLRVMLLLARKLKSNSGKMILCHLNSGVYAVFDISGFSAIFTIVDDRAAAFAALNV